MTLITSKTFTISLIYFLYKSLKTSQPGLKGEILFELAWNKDYCLVLFLRIILPTARPHTINYLNHRIFPTECLLDKHVTSNNLLLHSHFCFLASEKLKEVCVILLGQADFSGQKVAFSVVQGMWFCLCDALLGNS